MSNNNFKIIEYKSEFKPYIIKALMELQAHEYALSDTRKAPSIQVCEEYFLVLLKNIDTQNGKIFVCLQDDVFNGFVSYYIEQNEVVFEEDNSNIYALISDICVLKNFQNQGIAGHLLDKVFDHLNSSNFVGRVRVNSLANNVSAIRAYEKYGFKPYEITYEKKVN
jgi:ribosomal protein S18 acetylase RimI-like enzyme